MRVSLSFYFFHALFVRSLACGVFARRVRFRALACSVALRMLFVELVVVEPERDKGQDRPDQVRTVRCLGSWAVASTTVSRGDIFRPASKLKPT